jgi:hypothetical protein
MGHAYTPGLKVTDKVLVIKKRILPLKGDVLAKVGDKVQPDTVIARTLLPGNVEPINVANILGIPPEDIMHHMLRKEGELVKQGEVIAKSKSFFGLFTSECKSKNEGSVESISSVTGQVLIRGNPIPVEIRAYLEGEVVEVFEKEGVAVSTWGSFIQGIFGIGGETHGEIKMVVKDNAEVLTDKLIDKDCQGKVVVGGSLVTADALKKAISVGAKGIVVGGFDDKDLRGFLGYDLGVAITGSEDLGITLVVTEGFGQIRTDGLHQWRHPDSGRGDPAGSGDSLWRRCACKGKSGSCGDDRTHRGLSGAGDSSALFRPVGQGQRAASGAAETRVGICGPGAGSGIRRRHQGHNPPG